MTQAKNIWTKRGRCPGWLSTYEVSERRPVRAFNQRPRRQVSPQRNVNNFVAKSCSAWKSWATFSTFAIRVLGLANGLRFEHFFKNLNQGRCLSWPICKFHSFGVYLNIHGIWFKFNVIKGGAMTRCISNEWKVHQILFLKKQNSMECEGNVQVRPCRIAAAQNRFHLKWINYANLLHFINRCFRDICLGRC